MRRTRPAPQTTPTGRFPRLAAGLGTTFALMLGLTGFAVLPASGAGDDAGTAVHDAADVVSDDDADGASVSDAGGVSVSDAGGDVEPSDADEAPAAEPAEQDTTGSGDTAQASDVASEVAELAEDTAPGPAEASAGSPAPSFAEAADDAEPLAQAADVRAYSPYVHVAESVSEWDVARTGIGLFAGGFAGNSSVVALVDGAPLAEFTTDEHGFAEFFLVGELAPGAHTLVLTADEGTTPERTFTVVADGDYYDPGSSSPQVSASSWTVTVTELADAPIAIRGTGYPINAPVDLLINGARQEAITTSTSGEVELEVTAPLAPGEYTVTLSHPMGSASVTFHVVPDESGDPAPAGPYAGQSLQDRAGGLPWDEASAYPVQFQIDADGRLSGFQTEFWWVCAVGGYQGSGYDTFEGMPPSLITVDRPFEISWADDSMSYTLTGVVNADGTAAGRGVAHQGVCGTHSFAWSAEFDGELPDPVDPPPPAQIPIDTPDADGLSDAAQGRVTVPATASSGDTVPVGLGTEHAAERVGVWLFSEPVHLVTATVSADGTVMAALPGDVVGEHRIAVYAADGSLIGWDAITITSVDTGEPGDPGDDDGPGTPGDDDGPGTPGDDDGPGTPGDDEPGGSGGSDEHTGDRADRAANGSETDGTAESQAPTSRLPDTGVSPMPVAFLALSALLAGAALMHRSATVRRSVRR